MKVSKYTLVGLGYPESQARNIINQLRAYIPTEVKMQLVDVVRNGKHHQMYQMLTHVKADDVIQTCEKKLAMNHKMVKTEVWQKLLDDMRSITGAAA